MTPERPGFLPPPPWEGPPIPGATWGRSNPGLVNPGPATLPLDSELETLAEAKRREWEAQGYPPGLVDKALRLARQMVEGLLGSPLYEAVRGSPAEREVSQRLYRLGLDAADKWIQSMRFS